ncbi:MAG TPA: DUF748 domain-containing protein [Smithella sp.]|nr:DUF748 domain-containing protein [Smithella sp.]
MMHIFKKVLVGLLIFAVVLGITGFLIVPPIIRPLIMEKLSATLQRKTSIEKISVNPYTLSLTVQGFRLEDPGKETPFVSFRELYVNADLISSLLGRAVILKQITLKDPYIGITRKKDGSYNFSDLLPAGEKKQKSEKEKPLFFSLNNIEIINGKIDFQDAPRNTRHTVRELNLRVPFLSNVAYQLDHYVTPHFSAVINGHPVELAGKTRPFATSRATSLDVDIRDLDLPFYLNYVPADLNCRLKSARLEANLKINFIVDPKKSPILSIAGPVALKDILLEDLKNEKILKIPSLKVEMASVEPFVPRVHLAQILIESPEVVVRRDAIDGINVLHLIKQQAAKPGAEAKKPEDSPKPRVQFRMDRFALENGDIVFVDASTAPRVDIHIAPLQLAASHLTNAEANAGNIEMQGRLNKKSDVRVTGTLALEPLAAEMNLTLKDIGIRDFQPYFTDKVKIDVTRGTVSAAGLLSFSSNSKKEPVITYDGNLSVANLATLDKAQSNDFVNWKRLSCDKIKFGSKPFFLHINSVSLSDLYARIIVNPDGSINVQDIVGQEKTESMDAEQAKQKQPVKAPQDEKQPSADIRIGKVIFTNGTFDFSDKKIKPNYSAKMLNLKGSITGLSSREFSRADVMLKGNLGYGAPIDITGKINPLAKDLFADIKVSFQNIELSPVTPYSSKYLGYPITKGKLSFNVSYLIDKRKLDSENKILIDQLTFGEKVESPDAIKAPVTLAVSLLTDRNGQINLDLPVSGSLDDPKFKIWSILWQIIVNLITKAVTSPFALLSSLTGGGEELSYIEFDYGSAVVPEEGKKKIALLKKALTDRPQIRLDIIGFVDIPNDKDFLKKEELLRRIKAQKLKEILKKDPGQSLERIQVADQEYEKYLKLAYRAADFPRPRNLLGLLKDLPAAEMEKLMLSHIDVTDSDLRQLAAKRAQNAQALLLESGDIDPGRIFLVEPKALVPEKKENVKNSRIDFRLK